MGYSIQRTKTVGHEVRRIALDQLDGAAANLTEPDELGIGEAVHDARKRSKKVRGLLRLVEEPLGDRFRPANHAVRDAAQSLSALRDARALLDTFEAARPAAEGLGLETDLALVHAGLAARAERAEQGAGDRQVLLAGAAEQLVAVRDRIDAWELTGTTWTTDHGWTALAPGLAGSYRRGRTARRAALARPTPEAFHEWRKAAKQTWYHLRLLAPMAPSVLDPLADRFSDLADALGDDHDLAVLLEHLADAPEAFGGPAVTERVEVVIRGCRAELERRATSTGARLYVESPDRFVHRMRGYWRVWHDDGDEAAARSIDAVAPLLADEREANGPPPA